MRALVSIMILACIAISITAIPSEEKFLESQKRDKRGGWGYEPSYSVVAPGQHLTVVAPQKTIATTSVIHAPVSATTTIVRQPATVVVPQPQTESFVWQSSPDATYYLHQRHSPRYSYYYYPSNYYPTNYYPSSYYPSNYYSNYYYPTTSGLGQTQYLTSPNYVYSGWKK
ncbi:unnamed protein product [Orchesella dallaii]|uniref:Uncharacterized protein n=1 Tax=Orchesella dallaii TaxID=48710 RepID=A0ABP1RD99_9HEXA